MNLKREGQFAAKQSDSLPSLLNSYGEFHGWVHDKRVLGGLTFLIIGDPKGLYQVVARGDLAKDAAKINRQSYVLIKGTVRESKSNVSKYEVEAQEISVLNQADDLLPLDPASKTKSELTTRIFNRPLDLRDPSEREIFQMRAKTLSIIRGYLSNRGFIEVDTPKIIATASEGGAELFKVDYFGREAYLAQSPQLFKEELVLGLGKVFEIAHYFRAEKSNTVKHLSEFMSVDVEQAMATKESVMKLLEGLIKAIHGGLMRSGFNVSKLQGQFPVYTYSEIASAIGVKFGEDLGSDELNEFGKGKGYYFIVDWPLSLKPFYTMPKEGGLSESFDLMYEGLELASGGQRIHQYDLLVKRLKESGLNPESFAEHTKVYRWGMPPHAGWGLGLDRLMMVLSGRNNIREVVLYPRDAKHI